MIESEKVFRKLYKLKKIGVSLNFLS